MIWFMSTDHFRRGCKECNVLTHCFVLSPHSFKGKGGGECVELQTVYYRVFLCVSLLPQCRERVGPLPGVGTMVLLRAAGPYITGLLYACADPPTPPRPHPVSVLNTLRCFAMLMILRWNLFLFGSLFEYVYLRLEMAHWWKLHYYIYILCQSDWLCCDADYCRLRLLLSQSYCCCLARINTQGS